MPLRIEHPLWMVLFLVLTAVTFSLLGFIIGIWADGFEKLQLVPLLIVTPLTFLGGSFYSIDMLPPFWQKVTLFNPVVYLISGFRWSFYGIADVSVALSLGMTLRLHGGLAGGAGVDLQDGVSAEELAAFGIAPRGPPSENPTTRHAMALRCSRGAIRPLREGCPPIGDNHGRSILGSRCARRLGRLAGRMRRRWKRCIGGRTVGGRRQRGRCRIGCRGVRLQPAAVLHALEELHFRERQRPGVRTRRRIRGRLFDLKGDFMATEESPVTLPRAVLVGGGLAVQAPSGAAGVTPNGIAVGSWFDPDIEANRGFVHFQSTGQTQFLPANTRAEFVSETGLVGGHVCTPDGSDCHAFHWSPSSQALAEHPHFGAVWMNNAGTMVGHYQPAEGTSRLATVDAGGAVTPLPSVDAGPGLSAVLQYIADDGTVFLNTGNATTGAQGDAVVIANGAVTRIGRGIAPRPDICGICDCSESTGFRAFSATGHAVGVDRLQYSDKDGVHVAAEVGFHWSARDGATVLRVGASDAIPTSVNAQGVVVGAISAENKPFIWQKDVGGFRLPFEGEVRASGMPGIFSRTRSIPGMHPVIPSRCTPRTPRLPRRAAESRGPIRPACVVPVRRVELPTFALRMRCSTN